MYKQNAYLIMAHADFGILKKTLQLLDDEQADFYVHIDVKAGAIDTEEFKRELSKSEIFFIESRDIQWGDRNQIDLEMALLRAATQKKYGYYHLLSGVDMPLKSPQEINQFFSHNKGKNFIDFDKGNEDHTDRVKYYHFFQRAVGRNSGLLRYLQRTLVTVQKMVGINRLKGKKLKIYKGANWFSITYDLAKYIVSEFSKYDRMFDSTICADEVFLQTITMDSPFKDSIVDNCLREIDWKRGNPYVYRTEDYEQLVNSENLFARKFSSAVDSEIVEKLYLYLKK